MGYSFFAMLFRMKYIHRWALMRNTRPENLSEHAMETAAITHCLALIRNKRFGGNVNPERAALIGLYHDCTEIITGDLPTPVKYHDKALRTSYKQMEKEAAKRMLSLLPTELKEEYEEYQEAEFKEKMCNFMSENFYLCDEIEILNSEEESRNSIVVIKAELQSETADKAVYIAKCKNNLNNNPFRESDYINVKATIIIKNEITRPAIYSYLP